MSPAPGAPVILGFPKVRYNVDMRTIVTGDRFWACHHLPAAILRRLVASYGPDIVIVHGDAAGVDESLGGAAKGLGLTVEAHPADWDRVGKRARPVRDARCSRPGLARASPLTASCRAVRARRIALTRPSRPAYPPCLTDSDGAKPKRLLANDPRLE